jgi:hypothetical protein
MRATLLLALGIAATGCTSETVDENTAYRRLVERFDSEAQCLAEGDFTPCYQTLTLCTNGRVLMDLVNYPTTGEYLLDGDRAVAEFIDRRVVFDLATQTSEQLPGRHPWLVVNPIVYGCSD